MMLWRKAAQRLRPSSARSYCPLEPAPAEPAPGPAPVEPAPPVEPIEPEAPVEPMLPASPAIPGAAVAPVAPVAPVELTEPVASVGIGAGVVVLPAPVDAASEPLALASAAAVSSFLVQAAATRAMAATATRGLSKDMESLFISGLGCLPNPARHGMFPKP